MPSAARRAMVLATLAISAGCTLFDDGASRDLPPTPEAAAPEAALILDYLEVLERLARAGPAEQAEIARAAQRAVDLDPTVANRLRLGLVLALPGHGASDPAAARSRLGDLLASPEPLLPAELALAYVMYQDLNARLALLAENQRLLAEVGQEDRERLLAANRRLQALSAENARVKQELDEARAKLEAVADLERSLAERQAAPRNPPP
jgi:hypothetical protein